MNKVSLENPNEPIKLIKSRKRYICDITQKAIEVGDLYYRVNSRDYGIFHFHKNCEENAIVNYFMNEHVLPSLGEEERAIAPRHWDEEQQQIFASMPDDCV